MVFPTLAAVESDAIFVTSWPMLIIPFVAVQIVAAYLYWHNRRSNRAGLWLPLTLLVGSVSLLVGTLLAIAILSKVL